MTTLPYRTILRLPVDADAVAIAEQEAEKWLLTKAAEPSRELIRSGRVFEQGVHRIARDAEVTVVRADRSEDGSRRIRIQLIERGEWEASITAVDYPAGNRRRDALVITATNVKDPRGEWTAAPPRPVRDLLAREVIVDGVTPVTAEPQYVGPDEIDSLVDAITDRSRSVSVIVAGSLGSESDTAFRARLKQLTSKVVGVAAVFLVGSDALAPLNKNLGPDHAVLAGRVRTFLPLVDLTDGLDAKRHRVLGPATFARALRGNRVANHLQEAFAVETRAALLERPLPSDIRRSLEILDDAHAQLTRERRIEEKTARYLAPVDGDGRSGHPSQTLTLTGAQVAPSEEVADGSADAPPHLTAPRGVLDRLRALAARWLKSSEPLDEAVVDQLESRLAREAAASEEWFERAAQLERELDATRQEAATVKVERDDLNLELSVSDDDAARLRAKLRHLQATLVSAQLYDEAFSEPAHEEDWDAPPSVAELANLLHRESAQQHPAFTRVEFTGDIRDAGQVDKRDPIGRYAAAFWEFVRTLHDYAERKIGGEFTGNVHTYLNSDEPGYKCSPQRHAARESDSVLNNAAWRAERVRRVPEVVVPGGKVLMDAHFKPTHADTVAPRLHYYDDTDGTGKIYIGYIGRHLTNTKTSGS